MGEKWWLSSQPCMLSQCGLPPSLVGSWGLAGTLEDLPPAICEGCTQCCAGPRVCCQGSDALCLPHSQPLMETGSRLAMCTSGNQEKGKGLVAEVRVSLSSLVTPFYSHSPVRSVCPLPQTLGKNHHLGATVPGGRHVSPIGLTEQAPGRSSGPIIFLPDSESCGHSYLPTPHPVSG